jgi:hypothetical protein
LELLEASSRLCVVIRLCLDAALYDPTPPRTLGARGLPRRKGARQPTPQGKLSPQAFLCINEAAELEQILAWLIRRWQVEVTSEEARAHLGAEIYNRSQVCRRQMCFKTTKILTNFILKHTSK